MKSEKQVEYQQNLLLKKEELSPLKHFFYKANVYEYDNFTRQAPEKKDYVSVSKGVYKQKLCNLQELYTAFKGKHPNVNIGFSKFCALRPKQCVLAGPKMTESACFCSAHQNVVLLVDAMDWDMQRPDMQRPDQINFVLP